MPHLGDTTAALGQKAVEGIGLDAIVLFQLKKLKKLIHRNVGADKIEALADPGDRLRHLRIVHLVKDLTKQLLVRAGVPTAPWVYCDLTEDVEATADRIEAEVGYPVVVKPCSGGSSVGVSMPENRAELTAAIAKAASYETTLLAERRIIGRELTVSYLGGEVLPAVEIIPLTGFYDYENKYQAGLTNEICPAPLTDAETAALETATRKGFEALRLRGYARFDFILDENGTPWCLEANTLPGMTPTSLLPQAAAAVGIGYDELCEKMVMMAVKR